MLLQPTSTPSTLLPCSIAGNGSAILNATDLHASTGKGTESRLGAGSGGLGTVTTCGSQLDVEGSDSKSLDLHATSHPADGLPAGEVGDVNGHGEQTGRRVR